MAMNLKLSSSPSGTRNVAATGFGGGPNLLMANVFSPPYLSYVAGSDPALRTADRPASSTADYYHLDGMFDPACYSLRAMGSPGIAIANAKGFDYVWIFGCDHPSGGAGEDGGWGRDATAIYAAFSNDPVVFPDASTMFRIVDGGPDASNGGFIIPGWGTTGIFTQAFTTCLVYNADDATNPFYLYIEGEDHSGTGGFTNALTGLMLKGADFDHEFTPVSNSHPCTGPFGLTGYQRVERLGVGNWVSYGGGNTSGNDGSVAQWTSTDAVNFTKGAVVTKNIGSRVFTINGHRFLIGSDYYRASNDDDRVAGNGMYVAMVPVHATTGSIITTGTPPIFRISTKYDGTYPSASYLQMVTNYVEDGIVFVYALHGFVGDNGLSFGKLPENGGGLNEQYVDIYGYVFDATAAAAAAPCGLKADCEAGTVTLSWLDPVGGRTFRVKRGTVFGTYGTTVGDFTGTSATDSPTVGSVYYYKVIALNAGSETGSRVVATYVS